MVTARSADPKKNKPKNKLDSINRNVYGVPLFLLIETKDQP